MFCCLFLTKCFIFAGEKGSKVNIIMNKYHINLDDIGDHLNELASKTFLVKNIFSW